MKFLFLCLLLFPQFLYPTAATAVGSKDSSQKDVKTAAAQEKVGIAAAPAYGPRPNFMFMVDRDEIIRSDYLPADANVPFTHDLGTALAQEACPILLFGTHILHNVVKFAQMGEKYINPTIEAAVNDAKGLLEDTKLPVSDANLAAISKALSALHVSKWYMEAMVMRSFAKRWLLFEYKNDKAHHAHVYLLIPRTLVKSFDVNALQEIGFSSTGFKPLDIAEIEKRYPGGKSWSWVCPECDSVAKTQFEQNILEFFRDHKQAGQRFGMLWGGHGLHVPKESTKDSIGGISIANAFELIRMLSKKGCELLHITTCFLGGKNLAVLRTMLADFEKNIPPSNRMIVGTSAITDSTVKLLHPTYLGHLQEEKMRSALPRLLDKNYLSTLVFPDYPANQFNVFFQELSRLQQLESAQPVHETFAGKPLRSIPEILKKMFSGITPYSLSNDRYELSATPQVRFPDYAGIFQAIDLDAQVQALTVADVHRAELAYQMEASFRLRAQQAVDHAKKAWLEAGASQDAKRVHKTYVLYKKKQSQLAELPQAAPIEIRNKKLVLAYTAAIGCPLQIVGRRPRFVSMLGGNTPLFINAIKAPHIPWPELLKTFAYPGVYQRRYFVNVIQAQGVDLLGLLAITEAEQGWAERSGPRVMTAEVMAWRRNDMQLLRYNVQDKRAFELNTLDDYRWYARAKDAIVADVEQHGGRAQLPLILQSVLQRKLEESEKGAKK